MQLTLKQKNCDLATLIEDDSSASARRSNRNLSFVVPGQGRVIVSLLFTHAADWIQAREQALHNAATRPRRSPTARSSSSPLDECNDNRFFRTTSSASSTSPTSSQNGGGGRRHTYNREPSDASLPPSAFSSPANSRPPPPTSANTRAPRRWGSY
mmetsp:Transcript_17499/g.21456  ORF Transcript_17499/g.21456 Transcript_17499/m.21456 type:complete len:155 (+) Transcript_17499:3012-3476(+)